VTWLPLIHKMSYSSFSMKCLIGHREKGIGKRACANNCAEAFVESKITIGCTIKWKAMQQIHHGQFGCLGRIFLDSPHEEWVCCHQNQQWHQKAAVDPNCRPE